MRRLREIPPTAGLPLQAADLLPRRDALTATLATQLGAPPLQLECSGTAALLVALHALKARAPNRSVVVAPAYTCPLVAIAVHRMGLTLRLCDTRPGHWDLDPQALTQACREDTLAILPTHLAGLVADLDAPQEVARATGAFVIEDAAQALGAREGGQSVGLRGDIGFFSLAAGKGLSIFEGGLLVTRDSALRDELLAVSAAIVPRAPGWELRRSVELLGLAALYRPSLLRLAYGMPLRRALKRGDPVAAVGDDFASQIPFHRVGRWRRGVGTRAAARLPDFLAANRERAKARLTRLRALPGLTVFDEAPGTTGSWPFLLVLMPTATKADAALAALWTAGLGVSRLFVHALPDYAYLADRVPHDAMPHARDFAQRALTISNSAWLDDAGFEQICAVLGGPS
ncbi:DegT/DnrJ/EryC1/StrS family aminotransferase [Dyella sp.]|uniref:DegT/DnrJ/EryC1/StrS family aminotransferase n=1 Tax=Dyella sp. TaxID=1869338 RepID=UPI003F7E16CB